MPHPNYPKIFEGYVTYSSKIQISKKVVSVDARRTSELLERAPFGAAHVGHANDPPRQFDDLANRLALAAVESQTQSQHVALVRGKFGRHGILETLPEEGYLDLVLRPRFGALFNRR